MGEIPCSLIEHGNILVSDGRKPWHLPLNLFYFQFLKILGFHRSSLPLGLIHVSWAKPLLAPQCSALGAGDLWFCDWFAASHTTLSSAMCAFDSFFHKMSCTKLSPAHQKLGGPTYIYMYLQAYSSRSCAQHGTKLWAIKGNDVCPWSSCSWYLWVAPPSVMLLFPPGTTLSLAASILPGPCLIPFLLQLLFYHLVSFQRMIKIKAQESNWLLEG